MHIMAKLELYVERPNHSKHHYIFRTPSETAWYQQYIHDSNKDSTDLALQIPG